MTIRILHTSDWHLGQYFYGKSRAQEHQKFLSWLLETITAEAIDAVIVAGDIFDTGTPPSYARELYFDFIVNMQKLNCQLIILAGNHDSVAMLSESKELVKQLNCHVIAGVSNIVDQQVVNIKNQQGELGGVVCAIPFLRQKDLIVSQAGQDALEKQLTLKNAIEVHYQNVFQKAKSIAGETLPIIATGHLTTVGASSSESVRDIYIGTLEAFPADSFPPADYVALGHIHRSQKVAQTNHIRYSGSPIPLSFDEAKHSKKILKLTFEHDKVLTVDEVTVPCFQPLLSLSTSFERLAQDLAQQLAELELTQTDSRVWLDIEIASNDYHSDLVGRIEELVDGMPVEVLLVRRRKTKQSNTLTKEAKITLNELSVEQVFKARLDEEIWESDEEQARKLRLISLFKQSLCAMEQPTSEDPEQVVST